MRGPALREVTARTEALLVLARGARYAFCDPGKILATAEPVGPDPGGVSLALAGGERVRLERRELPWYRGGSGGGACLRLSVYCDRDEDLRAFYRMVVRWLFEAAGGAA